MAGRPTVITEKVMARLCKAIAEGATVKQVCNEKDMPAPSTIYLALANNPVFSERYARAQAARCVRWADELLEIVDDGSNDWLLREGGMVPDHEHINRSRLRADTRKWLLSKLFPRQYGEKVSLEHSGNISHESALKELE